MFARSFHISYSIVGLALAPRRRPQAPTPRADFEQPKQEGDDKSDDECVAEGDGALSDEDDPDRMKNMWTLSAHRALPMRIRSDDIHCGRDRQVMNEGAGVCDGTLRV